MGQGGKLDQGQSLIGRQRLHPTAVLYSPPHSPSGVRGQSELSEDSPRSPSEVRAESEQSEDSPRTVRVQSEYSPSTVRVQSEYSPSTVRAVLLEHYCLFCLDFARTLLRLHSDSARILFKLCSD